jgi:hypothetical protein
MLPLRRGTRAPPKTTNSGVMAAAFGSIATFAIPLIIAAHGAQSVVSCRSSRQVSVPRSSTPTVKTNNTG